MRDFITSKKFLPVYFIISFLSALLFKSLGCSPLQITLQSFPGFFIGILFSLQHFIWKDPNFFDKGSK
ncbi:hypothetical protein [Priestia filamentosa]|uniref:hypothetical protein n=1 Tax=Priestia filamentosa TaxID=1402861 RepID=UPI003981BC82